MVSSGMRRAFVNRRYASHPKRAASKSTTARTNSAVTHSGQTGGRADGRHEEQDEHHEGDGHEGHRDAEEDGTDLQLVEAGLDLLARGGRVQARELDDLLEEQADLASKSGRGGFLGGHGSPILATAP